MDTESGNRLQEEYEEARMKLLMAQYAEEEGDRLWKEFEEAKEKGEVPEVPEELDQKCRKIIRDSFAKERHRNTGRLILRKAVKVAACFLMVIGLSATLILSVDAFRIPVLNFFVEVNSKFTATSFDPNDTVTEIHQNVLQRLKAMPVPAGYELAYLGESETGVISCCYGNADGKVITLEGVASAGKTSFDTEDAEKSLITLNGHEGVFYESKNYRVVWTDAEKQMMFDFCANGLSLDEFWELAFYLSE